MCGRQGSCGRLCWQRWQYSSACVCICLEVLVRLGAGGWVVMFSFAPLSSCYLISILSSLFSLACMFSHFCGSGGVVRPPMLVPRHTSRLCSDPRAPATHAGPLYTVLTPFLHRSYIVQMTRSTSTGLSLSQCISLPRTRTRARAHFFSDGLFVHSALCPPSPRRRAATTVPHLARPLCGSVVPVLPGHGQGRLEQPLVDQVG